MSTSANALQLHHNRKAQKNANDAIFQLFARQKIRKLNCIDYDKDSRTINLS